MAQIFHNYIDGQLRASTTGKTFANVNPANTNDVLGLFQSSSPEEAAEACEIAQREFPAWSAMPAPKRGEILFRAADLLERQLEKLAEEMTREEGKTLPEARDEWRRTINILRYHGGEGSRQGGRHIPSEREGVLCYTTTKPLGVVLLITPWNFPAAIPAWKVAPALVAGNTVVLKPASQAPLSAYRLVEALHEAGLPAGVLNFLTGGGGTIGNVLLEHPTVRAISFTGSCGVGEQVYQIATRRKIRVQLEMGGKNPTIILRDADLDEAVNILIRAAFLSTGQKCTASSRAIVERPIYNALLEKLVAKTKALQVGNGLKSGVEIGPAVDAGQLKVDLEYVQIAKDEGATVHCGGHQLTEGDYGKGFFIAPAVVGDVRSGMRIAQEEVFGPVLALMVADDFDDAVRIANDVKFGLSAAIVSRNLTAVFAFIDKIEAGIIAVNLPSAGVEYQVPFGGTKESSFGMREQGPLAHDFYTETRTVYLKYAQ